VELAVVGRLLPELPSPLRAGLVFELADHLRLGVEDDLLGVA